MRCIEHSPQRFQDTLQRLRHAAGVSGEQWNELQLLSALTILETERSGRLGNQYLAGIVHRKESRILWPLPSIPSGTPFRHKHAADFEAVLTALPTGSLPWSATFSVDVYDDRLDIPYRIYNDEPAESAIQQLDHQQQLMLHCLFTRHHDGHVRQAHLAKILGAAEVWVAPYVVQLVGEYVIEIVADIANALPRLVTSNPDARRAFARFTKGNRSYMALVAQRVASYWAEYYKRTYAGPRFRGVSDLSVYPGVVVLRILKDLSQDPTY